MPNPPEPGAETELTPDRPPEDAGVPAGGSVDPAEAPEAAAAGEVLDTAPEPSSRTRRPLLRPPRWRRQRFPVRSLPSRLQAGWRGVSLRMRLLAILLTLLVVALAATGLGTQLVLSNYLVRQVDGDLSSSAAQHAVSDAQPGGFRRPDDGGLPTHYAGVLAVNGSAPQVWSADPNVRGGDLPRFPSMTVARASSHPGSKFSVRSFNGEQRWRVAVYPVTDGTGGVIGYAQVALPLEKVDAAVSQLRVILLGFALLLTSASAALGWLAIRRAFVPLREVEETAAAIAAGDLSRRVPERPASTEVGRLTRSLNGMLAQIESAFRSREASEARTRRFAADASHELRTPLAAIRGFAELYRQGAVREQPDVQRTMRRIEDESKRMGSLVEDLLLLARLDEQRPARSDPVDLAVLAGDAVHDARGLAPDRTVRLVGLEPDAGPVPAAVTGDENQLRQVVANLLGNAVRHTPAGAPIEVAVGRQRGRSVLEVRDHGAGLPPHHAPRVFERFYRVDSSRARGQGGGSGLGLSIVAAVVAAHGGRVGVTPTPGGGATFRVELPAQDAPDDPEDEVGDLDLDGGQERMDAPLVRRVTRT